MNALVKALDASRRDGKARRIAEEKARAEDLDGKASAWRQSQLLREYIAAVESAAIRKFGQINPDSDLGRWLDWAKRRAERVGPIDAVLGGFDRADGGHGELDGVEAD